MSRITSTLTMQLVDDVSRPARSVAQALRDTERTARMAAKAMASTGGTERFAKSLSKLDLSKADIRAVAKEWAAYAKSAGLASKATEWTTTQAAAVKQWESRMISSLRNVRRERAQFNKTQAAAIASASKPNAYIGHAAGAITGTFAASSIIRAGKETLSAGAERQHTRVKAMNAGIGTEERARIEASAISASRNAPNLTVSEIMELHKEARSAVQHPEETFELIPDLAKAASILKGMGVQNANIADIVKGGESLGLMNDPKRFHRYLEGQVKAMNVMGKTITSEQVYEAAKYSKSAGATLSDDFLNTTLPSLIQEMHGSSAGDALSMLTRTLRGGMQNKHLPVERLNSLGLLEDPKKIRRSKTGSIKGYAGKVVGDDLLAADPRKWFQEIFKPAAEKAGYKTLADQVKLLNETLPSTAANIGRILLQQEETLKQHARNYEAAPGLDRAVENQRQDVKVGIDAVGASLKDLAASVTGPTMPQIASGLNALSSSIKSFAAVAQDSPALGTSITTIAGIGAAATGITAFGVAAKGIQQIPLLQTSTMLMRVAGAFEVLAAATPPVAAILAGAAAMKGITDSIESARLSVKEEGKTYTSDVLLGLANWLNGKGFGRDKKYVDTFDAEDYARKAREKEAAKKSELWLPGSDVPVPPRRPSDIGSAQPKVDVSKITPAKEAADETSHALDALNKTVTPAVNKSQLQETMELISRIEAGLARINGGIGGLSAKAAGLRSLGSIQRGSFTSSGVQGE